MKRLRLIPENTNIDFIRLRPLTFLIALIIIVGSCIGFFKKGLNYGIDFKGGYIFEVRMPKVPNLEELRKSFEELKLGEVAIQSFGDSKDLLIKLERHEDADNAGQAYALDAVKKVLGPDVDFYKTETVGPKVGRELIQNGLKAVAFALIAMLVYIAIRFEWQFALCAILALMHDCVAILGLFSVFPLEFNETAIICILITAGYSINDTIVIFDRIRENIRKYKNVALSQIINRSVNETLSRTTLTATTTLLALLALYFFGGKIISTFSIPIIIGILVGSFSSICLASPLLLHMKFHDQHEPKPEKPLNPYDEVKFLKKR